MVLDINLFRKEKGGDPELIKASQRRRFASEEIVDEIIALDIEVKACKVSFKVSCMLLIILFYSGA
jgi:hypothetical protein